jgi:hypothetical protein
MLYKLIKLLTPIVVTVSALNMVDNHHAVIWSLFLIAEGLIVWGEKLPKHQ